MNHKTHKYSRKIFPDSKKVYYKCILPNCSHYILEPFIWNKIMICNQCNEEFILSRRKQNQVKPKCLACTGVKDESEEAKVNKLLENLL